MNRLLVALEGLRDATQYEFDEQVAIALILAIRAGCRNVLFRIDNDTQEVDDDDEATDDQLIDSLTREVAWILHNLFALSTCQPIKCSSLSDRNAFHRALLSASPSPTNTNTTAASNGPERKRSLRQPRRSMSHPVNPAAQVGETAAAGTDGGQSSAGEDLYPTNPAGGALAPPSDYYLPTAQRKRIEAKRHATSILTVNTTNTTARISSTPSPRSPQQSAKAFAKRNAVANNSGGGLAGGAATKTELPQVVVLQALDQASPSAQQAMLDMFRERRIVSEQLGGSWNVPDTFVCVAIVVRNSHSSSRMDGATVQNDTRSKWKDEWGRSTCLDRYLLDHFAYSATIDDTSKLYKHASSSSPSSYHNGPPPTFGHPLATTLMSIEPVVSSPPPRLTADMTTYVLDLVSTIRHHPMLDGRLVTARSKAMLVRFAHTWAVLTRSSSEDDADTSIEPKDVLPVLVGVFGHRLRMTDPRNEKSVFWGSDVRALESRRRLAAPSSSHRRHGQTTKWKDVKGVLHEIVQRV